MKKIISCLSILILGVLLFQPVSANLSGGSLGGNTGSETGSDPGTSVHWVRNFGWAYIPAQSKGTSNANMTSLWDGFLKERTGTSHANRLTNEINPLPHDNSSNLEE